MMYTIDRQEELLLTLEFSLLYLSFLEFSAEGSHSLHQDLPIVRIST